MWSVCTPLLLNHCCIALAVNAEPLSERMWAGGPRVTNSSTSAANTSSLLSLRPTGKARHSWFHTTANLPAFMEHKAPRLHTCEQGLVGCRQLGFSACGQRLARRRQCLARRKPCSERQQLPRPHRCYSESTTRERGFAQRVRAGDDCLTQPSPR
jgi:hypothetical protein